MSAWANAIDADALLAGFSLAASVGLVIAAATIGLTILRRFMQP